MKFVSWFSACHKLKQSRFVSHLASYVGGLGLCLGLLLGLFDLPRADWNVPFDYFGDAVFHQMLIKSVLTQGWYLRNAALGMPHGLALYDFPLPDNLQFLLLKLLGYVRADAAWVLNVYFVLTYPLTMLSAQLVLRQLGFSTPASWCGGLLYTFLPYHLLHGENHLLLSAYFAVPLLVLVLLWLSAGKLPLSWQSAARRRWLAASLIVILLSQTGSAYYAAFGLCLLLSVALSRIVRTRQWRAALPSLVLLTLLFVASGASLLPNIVYRVRHGAVPTIQRAPSDAETFGLKLTALLLPIANHRLPALAQLRQRYDAGPLNNENSGVSLGLLASCGWLVLLGWTLYGRLGDGWRLAPARQELLTQLGLLNLTALLVGTLGGFGALFALLVSPQIRAYNRICVYLSFFACCVVALLLDELGARFFFNREACRRVWARRNFAERVGRA